MTAHQPWCSGPEHTEYGEGCSSTPTTVTTPSGYRVAGYVSDAPDGTVSVVLCQTPPTDWALPPQDVAAYAELLRGLHELAA